MEIAREYNRKKDVKKKVCVCADCGTEIKMNGYHCWSFGVYLCPPCQKNRIIWDK